MGKNNCLRAPELLAPAGDMECLKAAVRYGADAVYLAGSEFGMRTSSKNFSEKELHAAVNFAHERDVKIYLTCNTVPRNDEIVRLPEFIEKASLSGIDAFIVTDIGVLNSIKKYAPECEVHISAQAGITNYAAANAFFQLGAARAVLARELSIEEIIEIRQNIPQDKEIECFVHGAMCMSFSGRCLLSNYLTGRDSNRGDCAQPCRWKYSVVEQTRPGEYFSITEDENGTYIFNSRDMCMINHLPVLIKAGVSSLKIEGRAKSSYYVAVVTNAYRCAIDDYMDNPSDDYVPQSWIADEVNKVSHREYCTGFYFSNPMENANIYKENSYIRDWDVCAVVLSSDGEYVTAEQRNRFFEDDELEVLEPHAKPYKVLVEGLTDENGQRIEAAPHPKMKLRFKCSREIPPDSILRKQK